MRLSTIQSRAPFVLCFFIFLLMNARGAVLPLPNQESRLPEIPSSTASEHLLSKVNPEYPVIAKAAHTEGKVVVRVVISAEGTVNSVVPIKGHPIFLQSTIDAVKQWRYKPFLIENRPVDVSTIVELDFSLGIPQRDILQEETAAVILAIQDELYAKGHEGKYMLIGKENEGGHSTLLPVYISPKIKEQRGAVVYKFMPEGEIIRRFWITPERLVILDPDISTASIHPSHNTIYMDDDELCELKHNWRRLQFEVEFEPSKTRIDEAKRRQKQRKVDD